MTELPTRPAGTPGSLEPAPGEPTPALVPEGLEATVVLLRHGESEWVRQGLFQGQGDSALSADGLRQAALAAERLAHPHVPPGLPVPSGAPIGIVHSPLRRTTQTAEAVAARLAAPDAFDRPIATVPDASFLEIGQGDWEGVAAAVIAERWGDVLAAWRSDPLSAWAPGGESLPIVDARARVGIRSLLVRLADEGRPGTTNRSQVLGYEHRPSDEPWAILVGHDGVFKVTLLALLDLPLARFWSFPFALCGITVVEFRGGRPRLRVHNATGHLAPLEDEAARRRELERGRSGAL
jgi:broad specificity phosphatase PhoE